MIIYQKFSIHFAAYVNPFIAQYAHLSTEEIKKNILLAQWQKEEEKVEATIMDRKLKENMNELLKRKIAAYDRMTDNRQSRPSRHDMSHQHHSPARDLSPIRPISPVRPISPLHKSTPRREKSASAINNVSQAEVQNLSQNNLPVSSQNVSGNQSKSAAAEKLPNIFNTGPKTVASEKTKSPERPPQLNDSSSDGLEEEIDFFSFKRNIEKM